MRRVSLLLPVLLVACSQQPTEDLVAALAANPVRLKALRAQCAAHPPQVMQPVGEDACRAAAEAFRRRFFAGHTGPDEYASLAELPPIPASFDEPSDTQEGDAALATTEDTP